MKTDKMNPELIARLMAFRLDARRKPLAQNLFRLRVLASKHGHLVEIRNRLMAQNKARKKQGLVS
jgi:hypothetical protein